MSTDGVISFGKYRGRTWGEISREDRSYLEWVALKDGMREEWKTAALRALQGNTSHARSPKPAVVTCDHPERLRYSGDLCFPCYATKVWKAPRSVTDGAWAAYNRSPEAKAYRTALGSAAKGKRGAVGFTKHRRNFVQQPSGVSGPVRRSSVALPEHGGAE